MTFDNGLLLKRNREKTAIPTFMSLISLTSPHLLFLPLLFFSFSSLENSPPSICNSLLLLPLALISPFDPLWDRPALPAGSMRISVICARADKPGWCSSCAVAWGWRQWHQFAPRTTCLSVTTNDKAHLFWSFLTNKMRKPKHTPDKEQWGMDEE